MTAAVGAAVLSCGVGMSRVVEKRRSQDIADKDDNKRRCNCPNMDCPNHGVCCARVFNPRGKGEKPLFS